MKKIYFLFVASLVSFFGFSQVNIVLDSDPGISQNGQTLTHTGLTDANYTEYMHAINTTGSQVDFKFRRVILSSTATLTDQFCDQNLCYNTSGLDWTTSAAVSVNAGDSSIMKPTFVFTGGGSAHYRYYVLDGQNEAVIDSVDIQFTSFVGVNDFDVDYMVYPNPATDVFNIKLSTSGSDVKVKVMNVLGGEVFTTSLKNGVNKLDVSELTNGVYFYTILQNGKEIETKKLVVR